MNSKLLSYLCPALFFGMSAFAADVPEHLRWSVEKSRTLLKEPGADPVKRRIAFRLLLEKDKKPEQLLQAAVRDKDPVIRRRALYELYTLKGTASYPYLEAAVKDRDDAVAELLIRCAVNLPDEKLKMSLLKNIARNCRVLQVRREAVRIADFPFYRKNRRLSEDPAYDHDLRLVSSVKLPEKGWRFMLDPLSDGHHRGFFKTDFNDSNWKKINIGHWEKQGYQYNGIAWYRLKFKAPEKIGHNAVELFFRGVDEAAWVWLNGVFIGQHDIGPKGWNKPFYLDVTKEFRWGEENQLTVRVEDTVNAGGIWKMVSIEIWK